jgi:hypothetical protein
VSRRKGKTAFNTCSHWLLCNVVLMILIVSNKYWAFKTVSYPKLQECNDAIFTTPNGFNFINVKATVKVVTFYWRSVYLNRHKNSLSDDYSVLSTKYLRTEFNPSVSRKIFDRFSKKRMSKSSNAWWWHVLFFRAWEIVNLGQVKSTNERIP